MTIARSWRAPILIALGVVVLDQATKHWAVNELADGHVIHVIWTLQFNLAFNSGMAFSRGRGLGPVIAVVATLVIVWLLASLRSGGTKLSRFGMGCLIGGAAGNLLDRLFRGDAWLRGSVVDFIDFQWFPIFNIADIAVNVGAVSLILNSILVSRAEARVESVDVMIAEVVPAALDGQRLDRIVALIADVSRADAAALIAAGGASVDGAVARSGKVRLTEGQHIDVDPALLPTVDSPAADPTVTFGIVHVDDEVIVIDKPAGLVVHPGAGNASGTLVNGLLTQFPELADVGEEHRPGIVHRLDAGSSGLLVIARTQDAADALIEQFADHSATRRYDALVWGVPDAPHGIIDAPIGRDRGDPLKMAVVANGRFARTDYHVLGSYSAPAVVSRLECRLETGRTHQIRVHLASIGHPLVGDPTYAQRRPMLGLTRPFLHAAELAFDHPATGERVTFHSPLAADLEAWLAAATP